VKKTTQISRGLRRAQLREVFALANVSMEAEGCPNIVRYYSSWLEDGRLHIQTELCDCSLRDRLGQRRRQNPQDPRFEEPELACVLRHVASGLRVLHSCGFAHLDIKPDNILVSRNLKERGCYKIADLGLAASAGEGEDCDDISEGDCRYLAKEMLRGDMANLPRADVFSLGLVCYELAINPKALPCNGEEWHRLREGRLDLGLLAPLSGPLVDLLQLMVCARPDERPSCETVLRHPCVAQEDGQVQALREEMRQRTEEAERNRRLADEYWHEMLVMKRQELLGVGSASPPRQYHALQETQPEQDLHLQLTSRWDRSRSPRCPGVASRRESGAALLLRRGRTS
jgi:serine/threonine protein kinase